jgi:release factor glutamine methyltransferase
MSHQHLWNELLLTLGSQLETLADKPEETPETTLKALWFTAAGDPKSAQAAAGLNIPPLDTNQENRLREHVNRRLSGTPLAHLTGRQQFMDIELLAGPEALIPRKETEILGRAALEIAEKLAEKRDEVTLMDICTGAGNLVVSLAAKLPAIKGYAADLSADAASLARRNAAFHQLEDRVEVREGDLLAPFDTPDFHQQVDLLICNPPYISSTRVTEMPAEIARHEPRLAFDGGPFGVKILRSLMKEAPRFLREDGWLAFEVGLGQGESIVRQMKKKFNRVQHETDDRGEIRVVIAQMQLPAIHS